MSFKFLTFIILGTLFGIIFLFYRFSYWQNSGFSDSYIIPIGNNYQVNNIGGASTYFEDSKGGNSRQAFLTTFIVADKKLCAKFEGFNSTDCNNCYIVFDTELEKMHEFYSVKDYETFALKNHLPMTNSFKEFNENYKDYWSQNNKWYLP
jgi:hypothetical protein